MKKQRILITTLITVVLIAGAFLWLSSKVVYIESTEKGISFQASEKIKSVRVNIYQLDMNGTWSRLSHNIEPVTASSGSIALEYERVFAGVNIMVKAGTESSSYQYLPEPGYYFSEEDYLATAWLKRAATARANEEIPLVLQIVTDGAVVEPYSVEYFHKPEYFEAHMAAPDYWKVYAITVQFLTEDKTWQAVNNVPETFPELPPEEIDRKLQEAILKERKHGFTWARWEDGELKSGSRYYGTYGDCVAVFEATMLTAITTKRVAESEFTYSSSFVLDIYYAGEFYTIEEAYDMDLLTKEQVELIAEYHRKAQEYIWEYRQAQLPE